MSGYKAGSSLFTATEAARAAAAELEYRRANKDKAVYLGVPALDEHLTPILSDNLVSIIANPGNGKTRFMLWWARSQAQKVLAAGGNPRAVIYATYEQSVEDLKLILAAADCGVDISAMMRGTLPEPEMDKVMASLVASVGEPMSLIGHSKERRGARPRLTMSALEAEIMYQVDVLKIAPHMIFIDYLQRIPAERNSERRVEVSENLDRCKDLALKLGAPVVLGVQAKREVLAREDPTPTLSDGQETSNVEQSSDVVLSLVRPVKHRGQDELFPGGVKVAGYKQLLISLLKQKLGRDNLKTWVEFDMATTRLVPGLTKNVDLRGL